MTLDQLNLRIQQLHAAPLREDVFELAWAMLEWMGVPKTHEKWGRVLEPKTMRLQNKLVPAPVTSQHQLYRITKEGERILVRFAVLKKITQVNIHDVVLRDVPFGKSWQTTPETVRKFENSPYTINFITSAAYDKLLIAIGYGNQVRVITLRKKFTQSQYIRIFKKWENVAAKPTAEIETTIWSSLDLKEVNKLFYTSVKERFDDLCAILRTRAVKGVEENVRKQFAVRLIGRYIFCWFLKEKDIIHEDILSTATISKQKDFYNRILRRLFFDTLNTLAFPKRDLPKDIPAELVKHFERIPYLNGGLFDVSEEDKLFHHLELNDWLASFVHVLEEYDFTVDESNSTYQQVAIDPEMLGRIFENLLASINPETEKLANERKAFGAFYTPREIVDYMVNQSLKTYLETHLLEPGDEPAQTMSVVAEPATTLFSHIEPQQMRMEVKTDYGRDDRNQRMKERIEKFFDAATETNPFTEKETQQVRGLLNDCKVIDPACGSGAFPMGVLYKLEQLHERIGTVKTQYELRRDMMSHNIYGVDIMPMAVEISRLRAWLALVLVCDYKLNDAKHNFGIKPLPNLDFKFVAANSLIDSGYDEFISKVDRVGSLTMMRLDGEIQHLERIRNDYFDTSATNTNKHSLVKEFNETKAYIKKEFTGLAKNSGLKDFLSKVDDWDPFNDNRVSSFFSPAWMFGVTDGFDVVIGNPPYVPLEHFDPEMREIFRKNFKYVERKFETSVLFILRGFEILNQAGVLSYISTITWQTGENYSKFRKYIVSEKGIISIINLPFDIFEEGYVDTAVYLLRQERVEQYEIYNFSKKQKVDNLQGLEFNRIDVSAIKAPDFKIILDPIAADYLNRFRAEKFEHLGNITISTQGLSGSNFPPTKKDGKFSYPFFNRGDVHNYIVRAEEVYQTDMSDKPSLIRFYEATPKVLIRRIVNRKDRLSVAFTDLKMVFKKDANPFIPNSVKYDAKYLQAVIASKFISQYYLKISSIASKDDFRQTTLAELRKLPIPKLSIKQQQPFINLVTTILAAKKENPQTDTSALEHEIDVMVYHLYGLSYEEARVIDGELSKEDFEKYKIEK